MKHQHSCECEHEDVRFCKRCQVVHCLGCNREWRTYSTTWNYPYWGQYYQYSNPINVTSGSSAFLGQAQNTLNDGHTVTVTACNHLEQ